MKHLKIKSIGPVKEVDVELDKLNVFIGHQSSGKSTIIKIACYCSWVEKQIGKSRQDEFVQEGYFAKELVRFHKLQGYLQAESEIFFESDSLTISYLHSNRVPIFARKSAYSKAKIGYIPSERNIVGAIPNWIDIKFIDNNIRSFMSDWAEAREAHKHDKPLSVLDIGARYFLENGNDRVEVGPQVLDLTDTSSGLQSVIPLLMLTDYFYDWIYHHERPRSVKEIESGLKTKENHTDIFLEEPEQNLYPETQCDLTGELIRLCNLNDDHSLTISTHSPYILSAINNLLYAHQVGKYNEEKVAQLVPKSQWIDFNSMRAYFVADGCAHSILDDEVRMIKAEAIDEASSKMNGVYESLLEIDPLV